MTEEGLTLAREHRELTTPLVSVVVRTRGDRQAFLREALRSIERQTYPRLEAVLVFDGPDRRDFAAWADAVASWEPHPRQGPEVEVQPLYSGHRNRSLAANAGVRSADGDYIIFLDDDDTMKPWHVERLVNTLETPEIAHARSEHRALAKTRQSVETVFYRSKDAERENAKTELEQIAQRSDELASFLFLRPCVAYSDVQELTCNANNVEVAKGPLHEGPFTPEELLRAPRRPNNAYLVRSLVARLVKFDETLDACEDYDFLLNLSRRVHFVHVAGIGAEFRRRNDGTNASSNRELVAVMTRKVQARYGGG